MFYMLNIPSGNRVSLAISTAEVKGKELYLHVSMVEAYTMA